MTFETALKKIVDECGGGLGIALMGNDGLPISEFQATGSGSSLGEEIGAAGAEFGRILGEIRKASSALGGGGMHETVVSLDRFTLVFRAVDEDHFVVLALSPDGNLGKARYLVRRHLIAIRDDL